MPERRQSKIRVLLCDDHAVVREGTRRLLEEEPDIEVVGEASDGLEAIEKAEKLSPDVVAMDVSMPRMNGIDATKRIKEKNPSCRYLPSRPMTISRMYRDSSSAEAPGTY